MTVPPNAQPIWSGSGSGALIDFSGAGTFFPHWFEFLCLAADARDRAQQAAGSGDEQQTTEALTAILFSALATEALINELGEMVARREPYVSDLDTMTDLATMGRSRRYVLARGDQEQWSGELGVRLCSSDHLGRSHDAPR